jgi:hypothetical protein
MKMMRMSLRELVVWLLAVGVYDGEKVRQARGERGHDKDPLCRDGGLRGLKMGTRRKETSCSQR